jgi:hypothetical protein
MRTENSTNLKSSHSQTETIKGTKIVSTIPPIEARDLIRWGRNKSIERRGNNQSRPVMITLGTIM